MQSKGLLRIFSSATVQKSILQCSAFFMVQLSHPYMTTGKTIALTRQTFVYKVMSLLFNTLSRLVIAFLPRSKRLLISWLQSLPEVILEPKKIKSLSFPSFGVTQICVSRIQFLRSQINSFLICSLLRCFWFTVFV